MDVFVALVVYVAYMQVSDNGIGIASECLADIFRLHAQINRGNAQRRGGMGVGLYLPHYFARNHHGIVQALSEGLGHDSRFEIVLPTMTTAV